MKEFRMLPTKIYILISFKKPLVSMIQLASPVKGLDKHLNSFVNVELPSSAASKHYIVGNIISNNLK